MNLNRLICFNITKHTHFGILNIRILTFPFIACVHFENHPHVPMQDLYFPSRWNMIYQCQFIQICLSSIANGYGNDYFITKLMIVPINNFVVRVLVDSEICNPSLPYVWIPFSRTPSVDKITYVSEPPDQRVNLSLLRAVS